MQRIFIKKYFPIYGGKCLSRKAVHNWLADFRWWRSGWNGSAEIAKTRVNNRLLCCRFQRTGKAMGQVYQCWWRTCREINVFSPRFEYHMFYVLYPFVTCLLTPTYVTISIYFLSSSKEAPCIYASRLSTVWLYALGCRLNRQSRSIAEVRNFLWRKLHKHFYEINNCLKIRI
jgi:hypothetical protein